MVLWWPNGFTKAKIDFLDNEGTEQTLINVNDWAKWANCVSSYFNRSNTEASIANTHVNLKLYLLKTHASSCAEVKMPDRISAKFLVNQCHWNGLGTKKKKSNNSGLSNFPLLLLTLYSFPSFFAAYIYIFITSFINLEKEHFVASVSVLKSLKMIIIFPDFVQSSILPKSLILMNQNQSGLEFCNSDFVLTICVLFSVGCLQSRYYLWTKLYRIHQYITYDECVPYSLDFKKFSIGSWHWDLEKHQF